GPVMPTNTTYAIYGLPTARTTSPPVVTGTAVLNRTLTTSPGSWAGAATAEAYQWQRCSSTGTGCVHISGATTTAYKLTAADAGHVVRSTVRATNVHGASAPAPSPARRRRQRRRKQDRGLERDRTRAGGETVGTRSSARASCPC